jgi:hypothetical protein
LDRFRETGFVQKMIGCLIVVVIKVVSENEVVEHGLQNFLFVNTGKSVGLHKFFSESLQIILLFETLRSVEVHD